MLDHVMNRIIVPWARVLWILVASFAPFVLPVLADNNPPGVQLSINHATPRAVEDTTQKAIVRDYSAAWSALTDALVNNDADALDSAFTGIARDQFAARVRDQLKTGLHTQVIDRAHNLEAVFYSPDGSAMELHDTAQVEIQVVDGGTVIHSEQATLHYVVLMTVAEDRWKVRVLQAVP
jgi:hypothetical protein